MSKFPLLVSMLLVACPVVAQDGIRRSPVETSAGEYVPQVERLEFDMAKVATPPALSQDALKGRSLFVKYCDFCHDGRPRTGGMVGPRLDQELVSRRGVDAVAAKIATQSRGSMMPGFRYSLTTADIDQLVAFMKSVGQDPKSPAAEPSQTRGRQ